MMKRYAGLFFLALITPLTLLQAETIRDPGEHFFNQTFRDFPEELEKAKQQGKKGIFLMFEEDDCPFCKRMKMTILNRPEVQDYFRKHFLVISMDIEVDEEMVDFQGNETTVKEFSFSQMRVRATPVLAFYGLDGQPLKRTRMTGAANNVAEFMLLGRFVVEEAYKTMSFTRYKRQMRKQISE